MRLFSLRKMMLISITIWCFVTRAILGHFFSYHSFANLDTSTYVQNSILNGTYKHVDSFGFRSRAKAMGTIKCQNDLFPK